MEQRKTVNELASSLKATYKKPDERGNAARIHTGKHYGGSHAPACSACRVTLSRGRCLNRMCKRYGRRV